MTKREAVNWLRNIRADIGKVEHQELWHYEQALAEIMEMIDGLTYAQPDRGYIEQIKWERDLAIRQLADLGYGLGEKPRSNGDLISRQGAIDAILAIKDYGNSDRANALGLAEFAITTLPSAEKHGRWVVDSEGMLHCSTCKEIPTNRIVINAELIYDLTPIKEKMKYCPKCGAKMERREE